VVSGGVGIGGNIYIGENANLSGKLSVNSTAESTSTSTGAFIVSGGVGISGNTNIGEMANITGNLNTNVNSYINVSNTVNSTSSGTGALIVSGGVGISKNLYMDGILNINRQSDILVAPSKIKYDALEWRTRKPNEMEFFLDYETMNSNFGRISVEKTVEYENFNFIFMVGIGYTNKNNEWEYKSFIAEEKTKDSEKLMLDNFWKFINDKVKEYGKEESIFIHWSQAEKIAYGKSQGRHLNLPEKKLLDLYEVFINEPITVKGALDYSLKSITKAMYKYNLISTIWDSSSPCAN
jgi:hypothetical protein